MLKVLKISVIMYAVLLIASCKKTTDILIQPPPANSMIYTDLQQAPVTYAHPVLVDMDNDAVADLFFSVLLLGDPILQRDRLQFYAHSEPNRNLLNDANDQSPVLNKFDIVSKYHTGYTWWEVSSILLAEKIITDNGSYWTGLWKDADHKYLPVQFAKDKKLYHGWVEISFDTNNEKIILHRAGLSTIEDISVKAGL